MPIVSVLTPVYNGERYLEECIESVLAQTYRNFEYIILDNCSTDRTAEIVARYTSDARVKMFRNDSLVPVIVNYNRVATFATQGSRYIKYVAADDVLFPDCLRSMVELAEKNTDVDVVASYKIHGDRAICDGPSFPQSIVNGKEVCKWFFEGQLGVLGGATNHLIRRPSAGLQFDEELLHADIELLVRLLKDGADYGFVHQVLTFTREHSDSLSSTLSDRRGTRGLEFLLTLQRHGPTFLSAEDLDALTHAHRMRYCRWLFRVLLKPWDWSVWEYQSQRRAQLNLKISLADVVGAAVRELGNAILSPAKAVRAARLAYARAKRTE